MIVQCGMWNGIEYGMWNGIECEMKWSELSGVAVYTYLCTQQLLTTHSLCHKCIVLYDKLGLLSALSHIILPATID